MTWPWCWPPQLAPVLAQHLLPWRSRRPPADSTMPSRLVASAAVARPSSRARRAPSGCLASGHQAQHLQGHAPFAVAELNQNSLPAGAAIAAWLAPDTATAQRGVILIVSHGDRACRRRRRIAADRTMSAR